MSEWLLISGGIAALVAALKADQGAAAKNATFQSPDKPLISDLQKVPEDKSVNMVAKDNTIPGVTMRAVNPITDATAQFNGDSTPDRGPSLAVMPKAIDSPSNRYYDSGSGKFMGTGPRISPWDIG